MFKLPGNGRETNLLLEILMIVIGINVALWFESWFQDLENIEIEQQYIADLRDDLLTDIRNLDFLIENGENKLKKTTEIIEMLSGLAELTPEEQAQVIYTPPNYQFFTPSDFTYRSMQESGDFRLLRDSDIKKSILRLDRRHKNIALLQDNFLQALDDGYIPIMMKSFDIATMEVTDPQLFDDQIFRNFFVYTLQDTNGMVAAFRSAREESEKLVGLIDAQQ